MDVSFLSNDTEYEKIKVFLDSNIQKAEEVLQQLETIDNTFASEEKKQYLARIKESLEFYLSLKKLLEALRHCTAISLEPTSISLESLYDNKSFNKAPTMLSNMVVRETTSNKIKLERKIEPINMLREEYAEIWKQTHNIKAVLEYFFKSHTNPIRVNEIAEILYETSSPISFTRCKEHLSAQLIKGAVEGRWHKLKNKNVYAPIDYESAHQ